MTNQEQYELICEKAKKYDRLVEVLDKIRAEIIQERESNTYGEYDKIFELCLLIIDKYRKEQE